MAYCSCGSRYKPTQSAAIVPLFQTQLLQRWNEADTTPHIYSANMGSDIRVPYLASLGLNYWSVYALYDNPQHCSLSVQGDELILCGDFLITLISPSHDDWKLCLPLHSPPTSLLTGTISGIKSHVTYYAMCKGNPTRYSNENTFTFEHWPSQLSLVHISISK